MTEEIYINGVLMEQAEGKAAQLVYQSPFFTDLDNIVSNRTNSVDFPATPGNLRAIEMAQLPTGTSLFGFRRHRASYYRDGVQIFVGYGTLLSITPSTLRFSFVWGNASVFQTLFDNKLQTLQGESDYVIWSEYNVANSARFCSKVSYGYAAPLGHPYLPVSEILAKIQTRDGITIDNASIFNDYVIPVLGRKADQTSLDYQMFRITTGSLLIKPGGYNNAYAMGYAFLRPAEGMDRDLAGLYDREKDNGIYNIDGIDKIVFSMKAGFKIRTTGCYQTTYTFFRIIAVDEDANVSNPNNRYLQDIRLENIYSFQPDAQTLDTKIDIWELQQDVSYELDVTDYKYLVLLAAYNGQAAYIQTMGELTIDYDGGDLVVPGGKFPLYYNLPDWTESQLLKNLMKLEGVFAVCPDSKTIHFVRVDTLYENRSRALDWTTRMMLTGGLPSEKGTSLSGFSQVNHCKYAEDESVAKNCDADILVDNETLDKEQDLVTLDFAAAPGNYIELYTVDGGSITDAQFTSETQVDLYSEDLEDSLQFDESATPRVLRYNGETEVTLAGGTRPVVTFDGLEWSSVLAANYALYQELVKHPNVLKASALITPAELASLDLSVPVYSYALGHYYAILKLTTKNARVADVELLQLSGDVED